MQDIDVFGRLRTDVTLEQAQADLARVIDRLARDYPATNTGVTAFARPFRELTTSGPIRSVFTGLMGAGTFLLLVACANVANLMLARGAGRAREIGNSVSTAWRSVPGDGTSSGSYLSRRCSSRPLRASPDWRWRQPSASEAFRMATANSGAPYWVQVPIEASVVALRRR